MINYSGIQTFVTISLKVIQTYMSFLSKQVYMCINSIIVMEFIDQLSLLNSTM